jgi:hypothetical protein
LIVSYFNQHGKPRQLEVRPGDVLLTRVEGSTYKKGEPLIFKKVIHQNYGNRTYLKFVGRRGCFLPDNVIPWDEAPQELRDLAHGILLDGSMTSASL